MSYTVIVDRDEERRQFENRINAAVRHCRIGKVSAKAPKHWGLKPPPLKPTGWHPLTGSRSVWPFFSH